MAISIDDVWETKVDMLDCHTSQFYEWLPYNNGTLDQVPADPVASRQWLAEWRGPAFSRIAEQCRDLLVRLYGPERGQRVQRAESLEICEYGGRLPEAEMPVLFPFFG